MCGIYLSYSLCGFEPPSDELLALLDRRGPDSSHSIQRAERRNDIASSSTNLAHLSVAATVLALRGSRPAQQPLQDGENGSILCWNGEAWKINGERVVGNDSRKVFELLRDPSDHLEAQSDTMVADTTLSHVQAVLHSISGPFSFIFYHVPSQRVFFGRDRLGRRSLLLQRHSGALRISSVADPRRGSSWEEVSAAGFFYFDINSRVSEESVRNGIQEVSGTSLQFIPWSACQANIHDISSLGLSDKSSRTFPSINRGANPHPQISLAMESSAISQLFSQLRSSISLRVNELPVSAGADSSDSRIAVLFSGGLDCTIIARILHDILSLQISVDLVNVAFENPRVLAAAIDRRSAESKGRKAMESAYERCPDRLTGLSSFEELKAVCPGRLWRFIAVNIPYTEMIAHRAEVISLMHPHDSEMDLSIALALYFAARGSGILLDKSSTQSPYTTKARVLLSGLGADELFAGYTRHRTAFERKGYTGLLDELELDLDRLGQRNLGRDDRVTSHWSREIRYPYLDEEFVSWALELPIWQKCSFGAASYALEAEPGVILDPAKHLLRLLAWSLGIKAAAQEKKRAIQFGARSAKMEPGRTKGTSRIAL